jgi:hypothetical protein
MWADGFNLKDGKRNAIHANEFVDNTDIDLVLGGCVDCRVQDNSFTHSSDYSGSSFGVVHLSAWPDKATGENLTSGDFSGTDISGNTIDCGPDKNCGFGLKIGGEPWYSVEVCCGHVHHNSIRNAQQGLYISSDVHHFNVSGNDVQETADTTMTCCGPEATSDYAIGSGSHHNTLNNPSLTGYETLDWQLGCIPNCEHEEITVPVNSAELVDCTIAGQMKAGQQYDVTITMKNAGDTVWKKNDYNAYRLGNRSPDAWGVGRVDLSPGEEIATGQSKTFAFKVTAPSTAGNHLFEWRMLEEHVQWFGESAKQDVEVVP